MVLFFVCYKKQQMSMPIVLLVLFSYGLAYYLQKFNYIYQVYYYTLLSPSIPYIALLSGAFNQPTQKLLKLKIAPLRLLR